MRYTGIAVFISLLLMSPILSFSVSAQPSSGNWVVTGSQTVQNESITLNGNLTVDSGGSLTLQNVALTVSAHFDGQYGISVLPGGSLYIYDSNITSSSPNFRFAFVADGTNFVMKKSRLEGVGWCVPPNAQFASADYCVKGTNPNAGPIIETNDAVIQNNTFSDNAAGLILSGNYLDVQGNFFVSNHLTAMGVEQSEFGVFRNNTFTQDPEIPYDDYIVEFNGGQNNSFIGNKVSVNETYITSNPQITNENWRLDGVKLNESPGNLVSNNSIIAANVAVVEAQSWNSEVTGNNLTYGEGGVNLVPDDVNTRVVGNTLNAVPFHGGPATFGMWADISHNSVITNNTFTASWNPQTKLGGLSYGIYLDHTSNSSIVNNNMALEPSYTFALLALLTSSNDSILSNTLSGGDFGTILVGASDGNSMMHDSVFADHSITILGSSGNMIAGDNFRDLSGPSGGPLDTGTNLWSNGTVGNYWSYFAGTDQYGNGYGSVEYARNSVPPNGTEQHSAPSPYAITGARVPVLEPIPVPIAGSEQTVPSLIKNQVIQIGSGTIPGGITIVNSTLYLAKDGTVAIGPNGGSITIENSTLIDQGYGFSLTCRGGYHCPTSMTIENSTLSGAFLNDINIQNLTIADSRILNAQGDRAISMQDAENVFVVNNTVSGGLNGVFTYCDPAISNKLSISGNTISNIIDTAMQVCVSETPSISVIGNGIESVLGSGIQLNGNAFVQGNTVTGCDGNAIFLGGTNNTIIDNSFIGSAVGIETGGSGNLIYRNNFIGDLVPVSGGGSNSWSHGGEGNYWSAYSGKDPDLDGIGDTPYQNGGVNDGYPFMQPNGWLSTFYLTIDTNLPPSTRFSINGSSFTLGSGGAIALRLGYAASYSITFPENVQLSNGSSLVFMKWGDGSNSSSMVVTLSSNSTLSATYALEAPATTTTTTTSASSVSSESSSVSTSTTASTSALSNSSVNSNGGGIPEFPFQLVGLAVLTVVLAASYLVMRRRLPN